MTRISRALITVLLLGAAHAGASPGTSTPPDLATRDRYFADEAHALELRNLQVDAAHTGLLPGGEQFPSPSPTLSPRMATATQEDWPYSPWPIPTLSMHVHAIFVANDDGSRRVSCTPDEVLLWVEAANAVYSNAGIHLAFDPAPGSGDWEEVNSTLLNSMTGIENPNWPAQKDLANSIAARTPSKMVVFFRWGPGTFPTGGGFSWTDYNFIVAPGFPVTGVCGSQNIGLFAHEAGHYLGLPHTFSQIFLSVPLAEAFFINHGSDPIVFDGDGRDESYPDPYVDVPGVQCNVTTSSLTLGGVVFPLPRTNVMSYYYPVSDLVSSQAWTVRQALLLRSGQNLGLIAYGSAPGPDEGENHVGAVSSGWWTHQSMEGFLGFWSGGKQFLWLDSAPDGELTFDFRVARSGLYDLYASFTAAPDFGIHTHYINGQAADPVDLYADIVLVTGPVYLGQYNLVAGSNQWRVKATGSNPHAAPARHGYGLDYILLVPRNVTFAARVFLRDGHRTTPEASASSRTCLRIEPVDASYANSDVNPSSIVMTSLGTGAVTEIVAIPENTLVEGDIDGNGVAEIPACFAREDLARLFSEVSGRKILQVTVEGDLVTGGRFRGTVDLNVVGTGGPLQASIAPNPMNPAGTLKFTTTKPGPMTVKVFDPGGRLVRTLKDKVLALPGRHEVLIDGRDQNGLGLASGIYFYRIEAPNSVATGRFVIMK